MTLTIGRAGTSLWWAQSLGAELAVGSLFLSQALWSALSKFLQSFTSKAFP